MRNKLIRAIFISIFRAIYHAFHVPDYSVRTNNDDAREEECPAKSRRAGRKIRDKMP